MNARNALFVSCLLLTTLTSCGTLNRAGKDLTLGVLSPALIVYGGATDGAASAQNVREGMESGGAVEVVAFPFTFLYHAFEHTIYAVMHIVDLPLCLFYGAAELAPNGPEIKPLDIYQGTWFDTWYENSRPAGTDAESGELLSTGR